MCSQNQIFSWLIETTALYIKKHLELRPGLYCHILRLCSSVWFIVLPLIVANTLKKNNSLQWFPNTSLSSKRAGEWILWPMSTYDGCAEHLPLWLEYFLLLAFFTPLLFVHAGCIYSWKADLLSMKFTCEYVCKMPIILVIDTKCILIMKIMQTKREETKLLQLVKPSFCHLLLWMNTNSILLFTLEKKLHFCC